jgi:translation factor GUF1, mitochondrial
MDVFRQRLEDEYDASVIITAPTVPYKGWLRSFTSKRKSDCVLVIYKDNKEVFISNPTEFPDVADSTSKVKDIQEPIVTASIIMPQGLHARVCYIITILTVFTEYMGEMMKLCFSHRAENLNHRFLDTGSASSARIILTCTLPLNEVVTDFFDKLKSRSSGFASFEYVGFC